MSSERGSPERRSPSVALLAHGEPVVWAAGSALVICLLMIAGLLGYIGWQGLVTLWPGGVVQVTTVEGLTLLGEIDRAETFRPEAQAFAGLSATERAGAIALVAHQGGRSERWMLRTGNYELTGTHFDWVADFEIRERAEPQWAVVVERLEQGRFYGVPERYLEEGADGAVRETRGAADAWARFEERRPAIEALLATRHHLLDVELGDAARELDEVRLRLRRAELEHGPDSPGYRTAVDECESIEAAARAEFTRVQARVAELDEQLAPDRIEFRVAGGGIATLAARDIVRAYPANRLGTWQKTAVFLSRWRELLCDAPREANAEGGVFPAIFGTVLMTLLMCVLGVPLGVLAALYLREYARAGKVVAAVRIAVNNLAGVPSIVFGVFGLGFFCYIVGGSIDEVLFAERLPQPTFGTGGLLWASLTLALMTLPVVIVATEEALAAVPDTMREGSFACGASKWQTIRRIVLPRALPGILTGAILAMARGAGEVAPLMLVGAVKLAPELPIAATPPFGVERSFMHLGFHIYDLGFQSQNSEAAKGMVFTTTVLLIAIIAVLNLVAIALRARLRRKFHAGHF